jgi:hypothetical protein
MRKKLIPIYSVLIVAIVLLAVFVPSCGGTTGTITVKATLCGDPWPTQGTGAVNYTLTPGTGSPINGTNVTASFTVDAGTWTCDYVSGGPADTCLESITPASVTVAAGETKIITIEFEYCEDAWIELPPQPWTHNGITIEGEGEFYYEAVLCNIIDVHFLQGVDGCEGYQVAVNETSWLKITQIGGPAGVMIYVVNDWWALNKTDGQGAPEKVSQNTTHEGEFVNPGGAPIPLTSGGPAVNLDVETVWQLVKETDYTKSINWLGISKAPFIEPPHPYVLFELVLPGAGFYTFTLVASAEVAVVDDVDTENDQAISPQLTLTVNVP